MLKYTFENEEQELKAWVDPTSGSLNIQIGGESVDVPYEIGLELVFVLKQKQASFKELERKKQSTWTKLMEMISGERKFGYWGTSWSEA